MIDKDGLKYFILTSIISADNDRYTEDVKQEVISRMDKESPDFKFKKDSNWEYILEPLGDDAHKYIELLRA